MLDISTLLKMQDILSSSKRMLIQRMPIQLAVHTKGHVIMIYSGLIYKYSKVQTGTAALPGAVLGEVTESS